MIEEVSNYLNDIRHDFTKAQLNEDSVAENPIEQYANWFEQAVGAQVLDPKAFVLSTVSSDGKPSARVVYVRGLQEDGLIFYTNYTSRKGEEIAQNTQVSGTVFWSELERQIRFEGHASKVAKSESDTYFAGRPRESQIGAWASEQSHQINSRKELEDRVAQFEQQFKGKPVPRPPHWGGYLIVPTRFEFWQGRPGRLHDRIVYEKDGEGQWACHRLAP